MKRTLIRSAHSFINTHIHVMKQLFLTLIALCLSMAAHAKEMNSKNNPDFAFPEKVEKDARAALASALSKGNSNATVEALVRLSLAKAAVSADSLPVVINEIERVSSDVTDPCTKALLDILMMRVYTDIYNNDRFTIDRRETVAGLGNPDDYTLWSRSDFLDKELALARNAMADADALKNTPLKFYRNTVEFSERSLTLYPTLLDFIGNAAADALSTFDNNQQILNATLLRNPSDTKLLPSGSVQPTATILDIYNTLAAAHTPDSPAGIIAEINRLQFISSNTFNPGGDNLLNPTLMSLYSAQRASEFSGLYLTAIEFYALDDDSRKDYYNALTDFKRNHPSFFNINEITNRINQLSQKSVEIESRSISTPGEEIEATVTLSNANRAVIKIYDISSKAVQPGSTSYAVKNGLGRLVDSINVETQGTVPFSAKQKVSFTLPKWGRYIAVPLLPGNKPQGSYRVISCTDIATAFTSSAGKATAWAVSPLTGEPVEGATIYFKPWTRRTDFTPVAGKTNNDGFLGMDMDENGEIVARRGDDIYTPSASYRKESASNNRERFNANIYTPLALYRPGDTVEFSILATRWTTGHDASLASATEFKAVLRNANYVEVASSTLTTDDWGRATGEFTLPEGGLTGYHSITLYHDESSAGSRNIMVSDYKLPTFFVKTTAINRPASVSQGAEISGVATTFAGFPVEGAQVKTTLKVRSGVWFFAMTSPVFYDTETTTGPSGEFTVAIPADAIQGSPNPNGVFIATITVTSPDGETRETTATFNLGKPLTLSTDIPAIINADSDFKATLATIDAMGGTPATELRYAILRDSTEVKTGTTRTGSFTSEIKSLPSGIYRLRISTVDPSLADTATTGTFTVYRPFDKTCPVDLPLWVPEQTVTAAPDGTASIIFGSADEGAWIRVIVTDPDRKELSSQWVRSKKGMQTYTLTMPKGAGKVSVDLATIKDFEYCGSTVTVEAAESARDIKLEIESFRDKVVPGDMETIRLRVVPTEGAEAESALVIDMSNKAIDILESNPLNFSKPYSYMPTLITDGLSFYPASSAFNSQVKYLDVTNVAPPTLNLYGRSFFSRGIRIRGTSMMKSRATTTDFNGMADEAVVEVEAVNEMKMAAPAMAYGAADAGASAGVLEEAAVENAESPAGGSVADSEAYRPSEMPLAFFRPTVTTLPDGTSEITYTVPDANTTWLLRALAVNRQLLSSTASAEIVASKPVMVSTNAPRFVRCGDILVLKSSVMNNTDSAMEVNVVSELVNPADGKAIKSIPQTCVLDAGGRFMAELPLTAPSTLPSLVYRVKATTTGGATRFSDGEQTAIPVLPSSQSVIESQKFYIAPDENRFRMEVPAAPEGWNVSLTFTENPTWEVVSALPGLRSNDIESSVEGAATIFSAAVARGLMQDNPEIVRTLRRWAENPSDSALISNLEKNSALKGILLSSTPWVQNALSDTERLQRLALLLNKNEIDKAVENGVAMLSKTVTPEGGWSWTAKYPFVSEWATHSVLDMLGDLNRLGWLPDDKKLTEMINAAVAYLDSKNAADFAKYPKADYTLYVYTRDKFPEIKQSTAASKVTSAVVQRMIAGWKDESVAMKAVAALILNAHGYRATGKQILQSLREYATSTPEKGMWWQQLDDRSCLWSLDRVGLTAVILNAFAAIEPQSADVDAIRQWLILQKSNTDWGTAPVTAQVITSILTSGRKWTINPSGTAIRVGSTLLEPEKVEYATGAFTSPITPLLKGNTVISIDRQANYPSFGAVVRSGVAPIDSLRSVGCSELSIEKTLSVFRDGQWTVADSFHTGDRVMVSLVVKADSDIDYVVISDSRAAALEPAEQLPAPIWSEGLCFYRENRDSATNIFISHMPRGTYILTYELFATQSGTFASGAAEAQSQYNPTVAAHSAGAMITVAD